MKKMLKVKTLAIRNLSLFAFLLVSHALTLHIEALASSTTLKIGDNSMNLTTALEEAALKSAGMVPEDAKVVMKEALDNLKNSMIEDKVVQLGEIAPDFELTGANGTIVKLRNLLAAGPVVVVFYRGGWCPFCNLNLAYLQKNFEKIKDTGADLVAISPELPDNSLTTKEKNRLQFEVLSDTGNNVARQYGIVFKLPQKLQKIYTKFGIDLALANGDTSFELPLAATFIVGKDGKIIHRFVDTDYKKRMDPEQIIEQLRNVPSSSEK